MYKEGLLLISDSKAFKAMLKMATTLKKVKTICWSRTNKQKSCTLTTLGGPLAQKNHYEYKSDCDQGRLSLKPLLVSAYLSTKVSESESV